MFFGEFSELKGYREYSIRFAKGLEQRGTCPAPAKVLFEGCEGRGETLWCRRPTSHAPSVTHGVDVGIINLETQHMSDEGAYHAWIATRDKRDEEEAQEERAWRGERHRRMTRAVQAILSCNSVVHQIATGWVFHAGDMTNERKCWKIARAQNNFYELFKPETPVDTFKRRMRMTRESFEELLDLVSAVLAPGKRARGDFSSPRRTLSVTILRLAHGTSFFELGELFAIGTATAHKCYKRGTEALCSLKDRFIQMPSTAAHIDACIASFRHRGFPNACLAVDGCHVPVEINDQYDRLQDFMSFKGFYSLNNMAYVDGKGMFRAVLCGWAGSSADGGVIKEMDFTSILQVRG